MVLKTELVKIYLQWSWKDKNGKTHYGRKKRCHSWLRQFIDGQIACIWNGSAFQNVTDTGNTPRAYCTSASANQVSRTDCPANSSTYGIVVGTDGTANTTTQKALNTQIAHGNGAGQLAHGASTAVASAGTSPRYFTCSRTYTNNSGGDIVVLEVGIYVKDTFNTWYFCFVRDVTNKTIANAASATATYTISITIS